MVWFQSDNASPVCHPNSNEYNNIPHVSRRLCPLLKYALNTGLLYLARRSQQFSTAGSRLADLADEMPFYESDKVLPTQVNNCYL